MPRPGAVPSFLAPPLPGCVTGSPSLYVPACLFSVGAQKIFFCGSVSRMSESLERVAAWAVPSSLEAAEADPGPMARLEAVQADEGVPSVVFDRLAGGESLWDIGGDWGLPKGRFVQWYKTQHGDLYDSALILRADALAHEALAVAAGANAETVAPARLHVDTNLKVAGKWDRERYGERVKVEAPASAKPDEALLVGMVELLRLAAAGRLGSEPVRTLEHEPISQGEPVPVGERDMDPI